MGTRMIHYTDRDNFALEHIDTASEGAGIWLYPAAHSQEWDGRYAIEFELDGDWAKYEYQRFECGAGEWVCKAHEGDEGEDSCEKILVECFIPASNFPKLRRG